MYLDPGTQNIFNFLYERQLTSEAYLAWENGGIYGLRIFCVEEIVGNIDLLELRAPFDVFDQIDWEKLAQALSEELGIMHSSGKLIPYDVFKKKQEDKAFQEKHPNLNMEFPALPGKLNQYFCPNCRNDKVVMNDWNLRFGVRDFYCLNCDHEWQEQLDPEPKASANEMSSPAFPLPNRLLEKLRKNMTCPLCKGGLLKDEQGLYCPECSWNEQMHSWNTKNSMFWMDEVTDKEQDILALLVANEYPTASDTAISVSQGRADITDLIAEIQEWLPPEFTEDPEIDWGKIAYILLIETEEEVNPGDTTFPEEWKLTSKTREDQQELFPTWAYDKDAPLELYQITDAKDWLKDIGGQHWEQEEHEDWVDSLSSNDVLKIIEKYYDGGVEGFKTDTEMSNNIIAMSNNELDNLLEQMSFAWDNDETDEMATYVDLLCRATGLPALEAIDVFKNYQENKKTSKFSPMSVQELARVLNIPEKSFSNWIHSKTFPRPISQLADGNFLYDIDEVNKWITFRPKDIKDESAEHDSVDPEHILQNTEILKNLPDIDEEENPDSLFIRKGPERPYKDRKREEELSWEDVGIPMRDPFEELWDKDSAKYNPIQQYAEQNGWRNTGQTAGGHLIFDWNSENGVAHRVIAAKPGRGEYRSNQNTISEMKKCQRGVCKHTIKASSHPCPMGIEIGEPEIIIDVPWPNEEPLTVPEEWPEPVEEPAPEREREKEPVHSKISKDIEDIPHGFSNEPIVGWKILNVLQDGTLASPAHYAEWPVGRPLEALDMDMSHIVRGTSGIHACKDPHDAELRGYVRDSSSVLVKVALFSSRDGQAQVVVGSEGYRAPAAMVKLVIGTNKEQLLLIANKYGVDTELEGDTLQEIFTGSNSWKILKAISFLNQSDDNQDLTIENADGKVEGRVYFLNGEVEDVSGDLPETQKLLTEYFNSIEYHPIWNRDHSQDWEPEIILSEYRDKHYVTQNDFFSQEFDLGDFGDDVDMESTFEDVPSQDYDEYGIRYWTQIRTEYLPPQLIFSPNDWDKIFVSMIMQADQYQDYLTQTAKMLVEIPRFMESQQTQEWEGDFESFLTMELSKGEQILDETVNTDDTGNWRNQVNWGDQFLQMIKRDATQPGEGQTQMQLSKLADYFYDWQGYYPDDGSLEDGRVKPSGPAPAFINTPRRCTDCGKASPPGHFINVDEYKRRDPLLCEECRNKKEKTPNPGYAQPMEYDEIGPMHSPWNVLNKTHPKKKISEHLFDQGPSPDQKQLNLFQYGDVVKWANPKYKPDAVGVIYNIYDDRTVEVYWGNSSGTFRPEQLRHALLEETPSWLKRRFIDSALHDNERPIFNAERTPNLSHEKAFAQIRAMGYTVLATTSFESGKMVAFDAHKPGESRLIRGPIAPKDKAMAALLSVIETPRISKVQVFDENWTDNYGPIGEDLSSGEIYDLTQTSENIKDGDILVVPEEQVIGIMVSAWPTAITDYSGAFHQMNDPDQWGILEDGKYLNSYKQAVQIAKENGWPILENQMNLLNLNDEHHLNYIDDSSDEFNTLFGSWRNSSSGFANRATKDIYMTILSDDQFIDQIFDWASKGLSTPNLALKIRELIGNDHSTNSENAVDWMEIAQMLKTEHYHYNFYMDNTNSGLAIPEPWPRSSMVPWRTLVWTMGNDGQIQAGEAATHEQMLESTFQNELGEDWRGKEGDFFDQYYRNERARGWIDSNGANHITLNENNPEEASDIFSKVNEWLFSNGQEPSQSGSFTWWDKELKKVNSQPIAKIAKLSELYSDAESYLRERVKDRLEQGEDAEEIDIYISDEIHEIADSCTPVYTGDIMQCAVDDLDLATSEPELGPAFDGTPTPVNIIAANIYEAIVDYLNSTWQEIQEEIEDEEERLGPPLVEQEEEDPRNQLPGQLTWPEDYIAKLTGTDDPYADDHMYFTDKFDPSGYNMNWIDHGDPAFVNIQRLHNRRKRRDPKDFAPFNDHKRFLYESSI